VALFRLYPEQHVPEDYLNIQALYNIGSDLLCSCLQFVGDSPRLSQLIARDARLHHTAFVVRGRLKTALAMLSHAMVMGVVSRYPIQLFPLVLHVDAITIIT